MADDRASPPEKYKDDGVTAELIIQADTENVYEHDSLDPLYAAKAKILNDSLQEIGMGKYQVRFGPGLFASEPCSGDFKWRLFIVAGFGWLSCVSLVFHRQVNLFNDTCARTAITSGP